MKLTNQVMDQTAQVQLYNELLNTYIYFFNQNHPNVRRKRCVKNEKYLSFRIV